MNATALRKQLKKAEQDLNDLRAELPDFESLVNGNSAALTAAWEEYRASKSGLDKLGQAQRRMSESTALLEQHKHDIFKTEKRAEDLSYRYRKQSSGERMAAALKEHDVLLIDYRDALRATIDALQNNLRKAKLKHDALEDLRDEIQGLAFSLDLKRPTFTRLDMHGDGFKAILFDPEAWPNLGTADAAILSLVGTLMTNRSGDDVVLTGDTRQAIGRRQAERRATLKASARPAQEVAA
jgi:hypothetical protein